MPGLGDGVVPGAGEGGLVWGVPGPRGVPGPGGVWSQGVPGGDPPKMATAAGSTHPTGCCFCFCFFFEGGGMEDKSFLPRLLDSENEFESEGACVPRNCSFIFLFYQSSFFIEKKTMEASHFYVGHY